VPVSIALAVWAYSDFFGPAALLTIGGAAVYLNLVFLVTIAGNVPMNNRLDRAPLGSADGLSYWAKYLRRWTRLNTVRTLGAVLAAGCYLVAAVQMVSQI
jgi:uncharacterized membrane protein